jgi:hypothetical protein
VLELIPPTFCVLATHQLDISPTGGM